MAETNSQSEVVESPIAVRKRGLQIALVVTALHVFTDLIGMASRGVNAKTLGDLLIKPVLLLFYWLIAIALVWVWRKIAR
ncbi:MAG: hypothetical protein O3A47_02025 [Chloroflexi bacterium]|nr:hypothetical protein [Chloroflexota bacterium]